MFIADLHVHSRLSRSTSRDCTLEGLHYWAQVKGVRVVGTGDFTHPVWLAELKAKLVESAPGLYRLRPSISGRIDEKVPPSCRAPVDFIVSGEISSIFKRGCRTHKVHSLILVPSLRTAGRIGVSLKRLGNIESDGRPILGLDPRALLKIVLDSNADAYIVPAHIWTPWFSMLGSKSGFDSPGECFGDLLEHIFAVETGLSSDPPMNWRMSSLDRFCLVSNSDLHSPSNLGRNANLFRCAPDFFQMRNALRSKDTGRFGGTIDLFPEAGKYHLDGHRKCGVCLEPEDTRARSCLCPVCGKPLVLGVLHRVVDLADRPSGASPDAALPGEYIIPLAEVLSELLSVGSKSQKVMQVYDGLIKKFGPELRILRELDVATLSGAEPRLLAEAIRRVRAGRVFRQAGFDGEYGKISVFHQGDKVSP